MCNKYISLEQQTAVTDKLQDSRNFRLVVDEDDLKWVEIKENYYVLVKQFHGHFHSKNPICWKMKSVFRDVKLCFNAS